MLTKAIIEERVDKYLYKVRIPILNKSAYSTSGTLKENLSIASVCTIPGMSIYYSVGDVVFVDFENDDLGSPVILGVLYRRDSGNSYTSINAAELSVALTTLLSNDTYIGSFSADDIIQVLSSSDVLNSLLKKSND